VVTQQTMSGQSGVRESRLAAGMTQAELAARAGVSRQLVAAVEAGRHAPAVDAALGIARALGTTVEELFSLQPYQAVMAALGDAVDALRLADEYLDRFAGRNGPERCELEAIKAKSQRVQRLWQEMGGPHPGSYCADQTGITCSDTG
jgi:DNA-binding XRE family transcriptional regulator